MLEQEQFAKAQLSNEVADLQEKLEEYRKMVDRLEHQVNKKGKEVQSVKDSFDKLQL